MYDCSILNKITNKISFVVPCYNEEKSLNLFYERLMDVLKNIKYNYEIIFIDDGSKDKTLNILKSFAENDNRVRLVSLSRNFGQQASLICGFQHSSGNAVIELDCKVDLPFYLIEELIEKWEQGNEIVHVINKSKHNRFTRFISKIYLKFLSKISKINIPLDSDEFKLYDRKVVDEICKMKEQDKYILALTSWVGFKQTNIEFSEKVARKNKKNIISRAMSVASSGIIKNSTWPLCLSFWIGTILNIAFQIVFTVFTLLLMFKIYLPLTAWLFPFILFLFALLFTTNAFTNTYLARIYEGIKARPDYVISEKINF